jgi:hypothetical protein
VRGRGADGSVARSSRSSADARLPTLASMTAAEQAPTVIAVDWSGARHGERRKIWLASARAGRVERLESGRTRAEVVEELCALARTTSALVVGLDFAFAFPAWFAREHGCSDARSLWELVARAGEGWLATSPAPFWGKPGRKRPEHAGSRWRRTESDALPQRGVQPKSVFQIGGAGAVGTGSVRGMPFLGALADAGFSIWPFDAARLPLVVEIYPRYLTGPVTKSSAAARNVWLANRAADQERELVQRAASCEDAFDAFASALAMSAACASFRDLEPARDELDRLEGRIWRRAEDAVSLAST